MTAGNSDAALFEVALAACDGALSMLPRDARAAVVSEITHRFPSTPTPRGLPSLTPMESRVLRLSADGLTLREIISVLAMSEATVNTHRKAIREKLGARTTVHAVHIAHRCGMLS